MSYHKLNEQSDGLRVGEPLVPFSKILIPIDFSERCLGAARFAIPLAERFRSEITLLHVEGPPGADSDLNVHREQHSKKQLRDFLCAAFAHLDVKRVLRTGEPAAEIIAYAKSHDSDLIMMPTHGYGALRRRLLGSITAKVLQDADCPVWTGAHLALGPPAEWIKPTTVLCAVDANAESEKALVWASALASELNAALHLVHVESRLESPGEGYYSKEYNDQVLAAVKWKMDELQRAAETHVEVIVGVGNIAHVVSKTANDLKADLLVIGRSVNAASGRLGLNTYGIIRESSCPVVSV
jgi:nucleotide-binding universal stress UspA family protein